MDYPTGEFKKEEEASGEIGDILIPEGEQLFTLYNMFFSKFNSNPRGKKYRTDFTWSYTMNFEHVASGMMLSRLDNMQEGFWASQQKIYRVGSGSGRIDNMYMFLDMMKKLNAPFHQESGKADDVGTYWVIKDGKAIFPGYDEEPAGPLGLPVMLNIIHKDVPVLTIRDGAVKNQWGRYENEDYVQKCDETGKPMLQKKEFIACHDPKKHESWDINEFKAKIEFAFPVLFGLPEESQDHRGVYHIFEQDNNKPLTTLLYIQD
jgi:hypothetical protein